MNIFENMGSMEYSQEYKTLREELATKQLQSYDISASSYGTMGGRYGSGYYGASRGDGSKWSAGMSATGSSPILDHYLLRQNARSAVYESLQARGMVERYADTVIDIGLKLEATPRAEILKIDPEAAEEWARNTEQRFDAWARSKMSVWGETMTFYQSQRLAEIHQQRDGEYFVRLHYSSDRRLQNPLQIQFIDPNQINGYGYTSTYGYQMPEDGIIRDRSGREIAYKVSVMMGNGRYEPITIPAFGRRSRLRLMLHGYQPEYAGQQRGYSRLAHALQNFEKLTDFDLAHIQKAINHASINMYVKPGPDADASDPFDAMPSKQFGAAVAIPDGALNVDPASTLDLGDYVQYNDIPEATMTRPGVGVFSLRNAEDLKPFPETAPAEQYDRFVDAFTSYLAASISMPIEVLLMRFNQNYSASRASLVLFWRVAQIWREELAADFLNPIYEAWITGEISSGRIIAPGWQDPIMHQAWLCNNWIGSPMPDIDPLRHAKAVKEYIEVGATDLDRVARNLNGSSGATNRAKLARQLEELTSPPWSKKSSAGSSTMKTAEDEGSEEENG